MKIISLVNMKGGVAKTTLAVNIADVLSRRFGKSVLLIDVDPQFNATQCLVSGENYMQNITHGGHTICDVFDDEIRVIPDPVHGHTTRDPVELEQVVPWNVTSKLDLIPGDLELYRLTKQGVEHRLARLIEFYKAENRYDFIIIDTPPTPSSWMTAALLASDFYVIPVKPEPLSRVGIDLLKGVVERVSKTYGSKIECLGVVLTIVDPRTIVYTETKEFFNTNSVWKNKLFKNDLPRRTAIAREQGEQNLILDINDGDIKRAIVGITQELQERLEA